MIIIAAYVSTTLQKKMIWYGRKQQIKCSDFYPNKIANVLIGFHALTGADAASGFYRQSKKTVLKKIQALASTNWKKRKHLSEKDILDITKFVAMKTKTTLELSLDEDSFR